MSTDYLSLTWTISRAADTYGYNRVTLKTEDYPARKFVALGGGYDMVGTVFADWLSESFQDRLLSIATQAHCTVTAAGREYNDNHSASFYGMTFYVEDDRIRLDGGCGLSSIERIAEAIGLTVKHTLTPRGAVTGFIITDTEV